MSGQTIQVTTLNDSGVGSLRAAITQANADATKTASPDLITFASGLTGSIDLQTPLPDITDSIEIEGPGARLITIDAGAVPRSADAPVLYDDTPSSSLTISGLTVANAYGGAYRGGFLYAEHATVRLLDDSFSHDSAPGDKQGGAGGGGAVYAHFSSLTAYGCLFTDNHGDYGGALAVTEGTLSVIDSTFANNSARGFGGAINLAGSTGTVTASTITGNSVKYTGPPSGPDGGHIGYGGGIAALGASKLTLIDSIVAGNHASGNAMATPPRPSTNHRDVYIDVDDGSQLTALFSLIENDIQGLPLNSSDITGKSPDLGPLQNNGGETNTEVPFATSPVINAGTAVGLGVDQRGFRRTVSFPVRKQRLIPGKLIRRKHHRPRRGPSRVVHYFLLQSGTDIGATELQPYVIGPQQRVASIGDSVIITGSGFTDARAIWFGSQAAAKFTVLSDTTIDVLVPSGTGTVGVSVITPAGVSANGPNDKFTYVTPS
jgi:hypothetical protein